MKGEGPGIQTLDGCSVEFYKRLPYWGELDHLEASLQGKRVLELGCGTGRLTLKLHQWCKDLTVVDFSQEMLDEITLPVTKICADIAQLSLRSRFDVVLLPSLIINTWDDELRLALIQAAARHLNSGGLFIFQHRIIQGNEVLGVTKERDGIKFTLDVFQLTGNQLHEKIRYQIDGLTWTHEHRSKILTQGEIDTLLINHGFAELSHMENPGWVKARLA